MRSQRAGARAVSLLRSTSFVASNWAWLWGQRARRVPWWASVLLASAVGLLAVAAARWWEYRAHEAARQETQTVAAPAKRVAVSLAPTARGPSGEEAARINRLVRHLNTHWGAVFGALESQASPNVAVLSLEPDVERGVVRVRTEGPSLDELLRHAARLQALPEFAQTQLLRIEPEQGADAGRSRLSFEMRLPR
jgi:hypothetical protein